jgi:hypothetical protein
MHAALRTGNAADVHWDVTLSCSLAVCVWVPSLAETVSVYIVVEGSLATLAVFPPQEPIATHKTTSASVAKAVLHLDRARTNTNQAAASSEAMPSNK